MIAPVRCRWLRLQGEAARLLGSQKSRRFCRIAKSPTSFDPASITSGCRQPLMSAPASVPRVARPSEATSFARSVHPSPVPYILLPFRTSFSRSAYLTDVIFFRLCPIHIVANSALVNILPPQQGDRCSCSARNPQSFVMIAPVRCRWLRLHGEAARLLGSQKSQRFCRIAKSPTSFDPASIASGCCQPLKSAPASVPRVARPSEATSFARSVHPSPVPHTSLMSSSSGCALFT